MSQPISQIAKARPTRPDQGPAPAAGARKRGLIREPGVYWDYENYDTLLAVYAFKQSLKDDESYLEFPRRRLLDRIGMRSTLLSTDRFGDFILSSQVYTNARDLARFGLEHQFRQAFRRGACALRQPDREMTQQFECHGMIMVQ